MAKRKKPITCKKCGKRFSYSASSHPLGRLKKHMVKVHPEWHKATIRKAKRTVKNKDQLLDEMQYTDDMLAQSLMSAGIPLQPPITAQPVQHQDLIGAILTGIKIGQTIASGIKLAKTVKKKVGKKK